MGAIVRGNWTWVTARNSHVTLDCDTEHATWQDNDWTLLPSTMAGFDLAALREAYPTTLDGKTLPTCKNFEKACFEDANPNSFEDSAWTSSTLEPLLVPAGAVAPLILNSVLVLWRLRLCQADACKKGSGDEEAWRANVAGWLVSRLGIVIRSVADTYCQRHHIWLCRQAQMKPLDVIVEYIHTLSGKLPEDIIPSLAEEHEAEPRRQLQPTPSRSTLRDTGMSQPKTAKQPAQLVTDKAMPLVGPLSQAELAAKRPAKVLIRIQDTTAGKTSVSMGGNAGAKRDHPTTPPQIEMDTKRQRVGPPTHKTRLDGTVGGLAKGKGQRDEVAEQIDLSGMSFPDRSRVDPNLVPGVRAQVSYVAKVVIPADVL
jgi:hypothetical protein